MKVEVIKVFYDGMGVHRKGDIIEVEEIIDESLVAPVKDEADKPKKVISKK